MFGAKGAKTMVKMPDGDLSPNSGKWFGSNYSRLILILKKTSGNGHMISTYSQYWLITWFGP